RPERGAWTRSPAGGPASHARPWARSCLQAWRVVSETLVVRYHTSRPLQSEVRHLKVMHRMKKRPREASPAPGSDVMLVHEDRLFPADPSGGAIARSLFASLK